MTGTTLTTRIAPYLAPCGLLAVWELVTRAGYVPTRVLPAPSSVASAFYRALADGTLIEHLGVSALRAFAGLLVGSVLGVVLGIATGVSRPLRLLLDGPLQMLRTVPPLALVPLVIVWFGLGEGGKLFIVGLTVLFPVYLNTYHGVRSIPPELLEMGAVYGVRGLELYREVVLPGALPSVLVGIRFALGVSWLVLIVAESLGAARGLGYVALNAREFMQMDVLVMTIVLWAALGKAADLAARALERRLLPWRPEHTRVDVR